MIYTYQCKFTCGMFDIVKSVNRLPINELCPQCKSVMIRRFNWNGKIGIGTFRPGFYYAFGKYIGTNLALRAELSERKAKTGEEIVEVGNDTGGFKRSPRPQTDTRDIIQAYNAEIKRCQR